MRFTSVAVALGIALATAGCQQAGEQSELAHASAIDWRHGDVEDALAEAKEVGKPVILYWGAVWCPPCNQMKATLFRDPSFIAETQNFVPVYLDGDTAGAQRWGEQFGISGYPTVIILKPDGTEITRIASATMAGELPHLLRGRGQAHDLDRDAARQGGEQHRQPEQGGLDDPRRVRLDERSEAFLRPDQGGNAARPPCAVGADARAAAPFRPARAGTSRLDGKLTAEQQAQG